MENTWEIMRNEINNLHKKLSQKPNNEKMGYSISIGGVLNAYREGDISFDRAKEVLTGLVLNQKMLLEIWHDGCVNGQNEPNFTNILNNYGFKA